VFDLHESPRTSFKLTIQSILTIGAFSQREGIIERTATSMPTMPGRDHRWRHQRLPGSVDGALTAPRDDSGAMENV
jgi:hypothetical protein